jgi:P27 family predicted phage terminase small subunit
MRRLPPTVHELRGNPSKRRHLRGIAPEIPQTVPDPPSFLTAAAGEEWRRLAPELCRLGLLSALDTMPLAAYCQSFATWRIATVAASESVDERRELARIARDSSRDMVRYARAFGMTPSSRSAVAGGSRPDSKFDGLIG